MKKNFDEWNKVKKATDARDDIGGVYFREREIWWVRLGVNIGFEQDGTGEQYARPVIVVKKYNPQVFLSVPLSTTEKRGKYYFSVGEVDGKNAVAILSQIRLIDARRPVQRISTVDRKTFSDLVSEIVKVNFGICPE